MKEDIKIANERFKYKGFKLLSLELNNFGNFGDIKYDFVDSSDKQDKIYTTVIIGPNGTRKSMLLNLIIYIFKCINDLKDYKEIDYKKYHNGNFHLVYALNNEIYEIRRFHSSAGKRHNQYHYSFLINGKDSEVSSFELPITLIGNSINITDKFPYYKEGEFDRFKYLGIKYNPQSASTKSYIKKTIDYVSKLSFSESFLKGLNLITETFVGENKTICISYKTVNYGKFYTGNLNIEILDEFFSDIEKRYFERQKTPPFKLNNYKALKKDTTLLQKAIDYCNFLVSNGILLKIDNSSSKLLKFNISKQEELEQLKENSEAINNLYALNLLFDPRIEILSDDGNEYSLEDSSSGEHNLITSLIGLMATVKQDSILFIDEPEISLHPNWQMKYVSFLKKLISSEAYHTSHIIIASHSHFIISDLEPDSSKIIGLSRNNDKIEIIPFEKNLDTYGLSTEEILYTVFKLKTVRNHFLEADLTDLLGLISENSTDKNRIQELLQTIEQITVTPNDPMNAVIEEAKNYIKTI